MIIIDIQYVFYTLVKFEGTRDLQNHFCESKVKVTSL